MNDNRFDRDRDDAFDRAARARHAAALDALSERTRTQLQHRLQAALGGQPRRPPARALSWAWAAAAALVLAFAFGAPWRNLHDPAPAPQLAAGANDPATPAPAAGTSAVATLDQNPDFYLWLASSDAVALAAE